MHSAGNAMRAALNARDAIWGYVWACMISHKPPKLDCWVDGDACRADACFHSVADATVATKVKRSNV